MSVPNSSDTAWLNSQSGNATMRCSPREINVLGSLVGYMSSDKGAAEKTRRGWDRARTSPLTDEINLCNFEDREDKCFIWIKGKR